MKQILAVAAASAAFLCLLPPRPMICSPAIRLACEAVLCLSSGDRPSECAPSIKRYFSIKHKSSAIRLKAVA